jgi:hypothetical protein
MSIALAGSDFLEETARLGDSNAFSSAMMVTDAPPPRIFESAGSGSSETAWTVVGTVVVLVVFVAVITAIVLRRGADSTESTGAGNEMVAVDSGTSYDMFEYENEEQFQEVEFLNPVSDSGEAEFSFGPFGDEADFAPSDNAHE